MNKTIIAVLAGKPVTSFFNIFGKTDPEKIGLAGLSKTENSVLRHLERIPAFILPVIMPAIFPIFLFLLLRLKTNKSVSAVVLSGHRIKILSTWPARLLRLKVFWLEEPGLAEASRKKPLYKLFSKKARIIVFSGFDASALESAGISKKNIEVLRPGIDPKSSQRQENIFTRLAENEKNRFRKFFTVGTSLDLESKQNIELLFAAVKKCYSVIPEIQLIVIGDGQARKNIAWIAKKMEIDALVWFVGKHSPIKKWAENLDLYAVASEKFLTYDINSLLQAMAAGLPIVSTPMKIMDEYVTHLGNGLITDTEDSEALSQAIIRLVQNKELRRKLGEESREMIDMNFNLDNMIGRLEEIILKRQ